LPTILRIQFQQQTESHHRSTGCSCCDDTELKLNVSIRIVDNSRFEYAKYWTSEYEQIHISKQAGYQECYRNTKALDFNHLLQALELMENGARGLTVIDDLTLSPGATDWTGCPLAW
jgi:hypothetical protein